MPTVESGGVAISYVAEGSGTPVVLVHGFASSVQGNWRAPGIIDALVRAGRRVGVPTPAGQAIYAALRLLQQPAFEDPAATRQG